jgi:hypothetical protein
MGFEQELDKAIKARILQEIAAKAERAQVVNNLYGGGAPSGGGGLQDRFSPATEDPFDYFVDIERTPIDPQNPDMGWKKKVRRYRDQKG